MMTIGVLKDISLYKRYHNDHKKLLGVIQDKSLHKIVGVILKGGNEDCLDTYCIIMSIFL